MVSKIPAALHDRLGDEGGFELLELLQTTGQYWSEQVLSTAAERFERQLSITAERFERRLTQEIAALRVEMAQGQALLRIEMHEGFARTRAELLRWSFLFWIGQVAAMAGLMAFMPFMLRALTGR